LDTFEVKRMKKNEDEHWFWTIARLLGTVMIVFGLVSVPYLIGRTHGQKEECPTTHVGIQVLADPCEYKKGDLFYKGYCGIVDDLLGVERMREDARAELEKEYEELEWYASQLKRCEKYSDECISWELCDSYYGMIREHDRDGTFPLSGEIERYR